MKKATILSTALIAAFSLFAMTRAMAGVFDTIKGEVIKGDVMTPDPGDITPPPEPSIFDSLTSFSGKVASMTASPVGNYVCKDATIKLDIHTGFSRGLIQARDLSEDSPNVDALLLRGAPVKVTVNTPATANTPAGTKTVLIPEIEAERFKAVLGILQAAKLTNKDVVFQVPTVSVPNCPGAFYAADVTFSN